MGHRQDRFDTDQDRRDFLKGTANLLAAGTLLGALDSSQSAQGATADPLPIIDTHQHLWDLTKFHLPWMKSAPELNKSYLAKDYAEATAGLNVVKAIYMEVDVVPSEQVKEAEMILGVCQLRNTPTVAAVISGRPDSDGFAAYLQRFQGVKELKGVRQVLHVPETPQGYALRPEFVRGMNVLQEMGLSFDLCMRGKDLKDAAKLADLAPKTRFILDHCGNPQVLDKDQTAWKADISAIADKHNVVCKVSGILASTKGKPWTAEDLAPVVNHVLDSFGPDRVMFGGDWPVVTLGGTYRQWVEALRTIVKNRPLDDQRKLFHDNALKYYGLA